MYTEKNRTCYRGENCNLETNKQSCTMVVEGLDCQGYGGRGRIYGNVPPAPYFGAYRMKEIA